MIRAAQQRSTVRDDEAGLSFFRKDAFPELTSRSLHPGAGKVIEDQQLPRMNMRAAVAAFARPRA
jgi:hypothetical protein